MSWARTTVKERIVLHLLRFSSFLGEGTAPPEVTQSGIAECVGANRPHVSMALRDLKAEGLVEERKLHVKGAPRRMQTYSLSPQGLIEARRLKGDIAARTVSFGGEERTVGDLARELELPGMAELLANVNDDGVYVAPGERPLPAEAATVPGAEPAPAMPELPPPPPEVSTRVASGVLIFIIGYAMLWGAPLLALFYYSCATASCGVFLLGLLLVSIGTSMTTQVERVYRRVALFLGLHPLALAAIVLYLYTNDWRIAGSEVRTFLAVSAALVLGALLPTGIDRARRAELLRALSIFLAVYSVSSMAVGAGTSSPLWMLLSGVLLLISLELHREPLSRWAKSIAVGVGLSITALSITYAYGAGGGAGLALAIVWAGIGLLVIAVSLLPRSASVYATLKSAAPLYLGVAFAAVSVPFFMGGLVLEGIVEASLGAFLIWSGAPHAIKDRESMLISSLVVALVVVTVATPFLV